MYGKIDIHVYDEMGSSQEYTNRFKANIYCYTLFIFLIFCPTSQKTIDDVADVKTIYFIGHEAA